MRGHVEAVKYALMGATLTMGEAREIAELVLQCVEPQKRDYSQPGDPYGIEREMTYLSAAVDSPRDSGFKVCGVPILIDSSMAPRGPVFSSPVDVRGNSLIAVRGLPTQAEADAVVEQARLERAR